MENKVLYYTGTELAVMDSYGVLARVSYPIGLCVHLPGENEYTYHNYVWQERSNFY